jgi:hypothetical protein
MFRAKTFDLVLTKDECKYLVDFATNSNLWESGGTKFWEARVINYSRVIATDKYAASLLLKANSSCAKLICETYNEKEIYSDTLQLVRWFPGMSQPPHADDMTNTDMVGYDHRHYGSILYLNDDYSGGNTYYPEHDIKISPVAGTLAIHPGDPEHLHGVTEIFGNMRYTIASFWTREQVKAYDWSLYK